MLNQTQEWAKVHAYQAQTKGGLLRYLMDVLDIHPHRSMAFLKAELNTLFLEKKVLVFVHIPKTGGNAVNANIEGAPFVTLSHALLRNELTDAYVPTGLIGTRYQPKKHHFLFSAVRNPLTFFRSYYHHVIGHGEYHNTLHYDYKAAGKGFSYLLRTIMNREEEWPSRKFLFPQLFDQDGNLVVDWISRQETMDDDMSDLSRNLGFEYKKNKRHRAAPVKPLIDYYDERLINEIMDCYRREFDLFGYEENALNDKDALHKDVANANVKYDFLKDELIIPGI